jgi:D-alanine-D-alanine ligase
MDRKIRVGVVFGGRNSEHEVSLKSARAVMQALDPARYEIVPIGIDKQGRWVLGSDPLLMLERASEVALLGRDPEPGVVTSTAPVQISPGRLPDDALVFGTNDAGGSLDVLVPVLHGLYGEDGTLQGLLEIADVPYVGCGVLAAAVGMDKGVMKAAFAAAGLPMVPYTLVLRRDFERDPEIVLDSLEKTLKYPMFTKPANAGSSVGISKCKNRQQLLAGMVEAAKHDRRLIIEQGVSPRELEVAVLGNDEPVASVVGEILVGGEWYDYNDKYLDGKSRPQIPADIPAELSERVQKMAVAAFKAIDGAGLARVDFLLDKQTGELYLNEINTFPGFTQISMYPKMWAASGVPYNQLLDRLIELAIERHNDQRVRDQRVRK